MPQKRHQAAAVRLARAQRLIGHRQLKFEPVAYLTGVRNPCYSNAWRKGAVLASITPSSASLVRASSHCRTKRTRWQEPPWKLRLCPCCSGVSQTVEMCVTVGSHAPQVDWAMYGSTTSGTSFTKRSASCPASLLGPGVCVGGAVEWGGVAGRQPAP